MIHRMALTEDAPLTINIHTHTFIYMHAPTPATYTYTELINPSSEHCASFSESSSAIRMISHLTQISSFSSNTHLPPERLQTERARFNHPKDLITLQRFG